MIPRKTDIRQGRLQRQQPDVQQRSCTEGGRRTARMIAMEPTTRTKKGRGRRQVHQAKASGISDSENARDSRRKTNRKTLKSAAANQARAPRSNTMMDAGVSDVPKSGTRHEEGCSDRRDHDRQERSVSLRRTSMTHARHRPTSRFAGSVAPSRRLVVHHACAPDTGSARVGAPAGSIDPHACRLEGTDGAQGRCKGRPYSFTTRRCPTKKCRERWSELQLWRSWDSIRLLRPTGAEVSFVTQIATRSLRTAKR
jgi:hypothetical protein